MKVKTCPRCGIELVLLEEFFIGTKRKKSSFYYICPNCEDEFTGKSVLVKRYLNILYLDEQIERIQTSGNAYNNFLPLNEEEGGDFI